MPKLSPLRFLSLISGLVLIIGSSLHAQSVVSTWNSADDTWNDASAWLPTVTPTSANSTVLIFGGSGSYGAQDDIGNFTVGQLQFNNTAGSVIISASPATNTISVANSDAQLGAVTMTGGGTALINAPFSLAGETTSTNIGSGTLNYNGPSLNFVTGTKQTFINSGTGSILLADAIVYSTSGTGTGLVLNFINNNPTFGSFSIGNMGTLANVTFNIGGTGTVNFVTGGNTSTGDLFSNSAFLNVLAGATFDFNGNGETFGAIEGAGIIHVTVGMEFAGLGNYNFSGLITGAAGNMTVDAANTYQTISGASNNYTGNTSVLGGHLIVDANAPNGAVGALGNSTATMLVGDTSGSLSSFLMIGMPGVTIGRNITVQTGNTGISTLGGLNTSGTTIYSGNITLGTASKAAVGVTLSAAPGGTVQFTGNLLRATGATGATDTVTVTGGGTVTLSGINTFTGATTVNADTLVLDNTTNNGNKISSTAALTLNGGSLSDLGSSAAPSSQSISGLTLGNSASPLGGGATLAVTTGTNQNASFALGAISRNTGATIDFEETNTGTGVPDITTSTGNVSGILGGYATFGQGDWAANDGTGNVVAYSTVGVYNSTFGAGNQTSLAASTALASGGGTANSLRFTSALALTFAAGTDTLTLSSGGLLVAPGTGATSIGTTSVRGVLASSTNGELIVQQQSTSGTLTINSTISATTLSKAGAGTLALSGTNSMTAVVIDGGTLSITATGNLGAATSSITLNGGTLAVPSGSMGTVSSTGHTVIIGPAGGTLNFTANVTFSGNGFSGTGTVTKTGAGLWSLGATSSTFSGAININQGTLSMTSSQLNSSGTVTIASGGTFNVNDDGVGNWFTNNGTQFLLNGTGTSNSGAISLTDQTTGVAVFADPTSTLLRDAVLQTNSLVNVVNGAAAGSTSTFIFGGNVSGPGALIVGGTGVVALSARDNSYTGGTFVNTGTLRVSGGNDRLPTSTSVTLGSASGGGVLQLFGNTQTIAGLTTANAGVNDEVTNGNSASTSPSLLTVNLATGSQTYDGTLGGSSNTDNTHTNNNLGFIKDGQGTLTLSGSNTYNGYTTVVNGALALGHVNALGNGGATLTSDNGGTTVNTGATLDMNGISGVNEIITLNGSGLAGNGALINSNTSTPASIGSGVSSISVANLANNTRWSTGLSVSIDPPGGTGTPATAVGLLGLTAASINIANGGTGYSTTSVPVITVTGGGGTGAVLVPSLGLTTASITVTSNTQTYSVAPAVTIIGQGAGGTAATGTAVLDGNGKVIGVTITNAGSGFDATPTITFSGGTVLVSGTAPTAAGSASQFTLVGIVVVNSGNGFTSLPTITITGNAALQAVDSNFVLNGFAITNNGSGYTTTPNINYSDPVNGVGGSATLSANFTSVNLATDSSIGGAGNLTISPVISGPGAFNKVGAGTTVLTGVNTYTGATNITAGNLQVGVAGMGTTGTGNITLNGSGAVLSGTGSVTAPTNVILGTIKPGDNGGASTGTLNMQSLTFSPTSPSTVAVLQITGSTTNSNLSSDKIIVSGALTLNANSNIMVDGTGYTPEVGDTFDLLDWTSMVTNGFSTGTNLRTGANSANNEGNLDLPDITGTGVWNIDMSGDSLIVSIVATPEPSRMLLMGLGGMLMLMRRRRR